MQTEQDLVRSDRQDAASDATMKRESCSNSSSPRKDNEKRKHRRKRGKRHKWKPYDKMSWEEKGQLEERDRKRAERTQAELWRQGKPTAPFNTNEFLMEDHGPSGTPTVLSAGGKSRMDRMVSMDSSFSVSDENGVTYESTSNDEDAFVKAGEREFDEMYEQAHTEKLENMSREDLISECMSLERRLNETTEGMRKPAGLLIRSQSCGDVSQETLAMEVARLRRENEQLRNTQNRARNDPQI